ncbi:uncharacterized protein BYT42DRAFT_579706 [Radiomyces spectabilis]|uniref:uncharacterized protein n=1 Tax=Radiomyces spectabilis TaxID=64574 RepID=UPI00221FEBCD|nr:uncharacterized protein BYT42DRAFT_579706 [Radiomyces spectabilis]KAI8373236.1 hypothetical protein BYT42DRAFT_579706 [Radiomyces spectabilis]
MKFSWTNFLVVPLFSMQDACDLETCIQAHPDQRGERRNAATRHCIAIRQTTSISLRHRLQTAIDRCPVSQRHLVVFPSLQALLRHSRASFKITKVNLGFPFSFSCIFTPVIR